MSEIAEQTQSNQSPGIPPPAVESAPTHSEAQPDETPGIRERIVHESTRLFSAKGFNGVSVREIAEAVGVTKPTLYYYFGSKERLFESIIVGLLDDFRKQLIEVARSRVPVLERLLEIARLYFDVGRRRADQCRLLHSVYFSCDRNAIDFDFNTYFKTNMETIRDVIAEGIGTKDLRPGDPWLMTISFFGMINLVVMGMLHSPADVPAEGMAEAVVEQSLRGMGIAGSNLDGVTP